MFTPFHPTADDDIEDMPSTLPLVSVLRLIDGMISSYHRVLSQYDGTVIERIKCEMSYAHIIAAYRTIRISHSNLISPSDALSRLQKDTNFPLSEIVD